MTAADPLPRDAAVPSPCIGICHLDAQGLCAGCGRSGAEIAAEIREAAAVRDDRPRNLHPRPLAGAGRRLSIPQRAIPISAEHAGMPGRKI